MPTSQTKAPRIVLVFAPDFPAESVSGRQFELVLDQNKRAWQLGRGSWCWPRFTRADQRLSRVHCTIYWNAKRPSVDSDDEWDKTVAYNEPPPPLKLGAWEILDGGVYPPDKRESGETDEPKPSSLGVWKNGYKILPNCPERLSVGDQIVLGASPKARFYVTDSLHTTDNPTIWDEDSWPEFDVIESGRLDKETQTQLKNQADRDDYQAQKSDLVDTSKVKSPVEILVIVIIDFLDWIQTANSFRGVLYRLCILGYFGWFGWLVLTFIFKK
jgi:hypothetical protein